MVDGIVDVRPELFETFNTLCPLHFWSMTLIWRKALIFKILCFWLRCGQYILYIPLQFHNFFNGKSVRFGLTKLGGNAAEQSFNGSRTVSCNSVAVLPFWGQGWKTPEVITLVLWHWLYNPCYVRHIDTVSIRYTVWCMRLYVFVRFERSYHTLIIFQAL